MTDSKSPSETVRAEGRIRLGPVRAVGLAAAIAAALFLHFIADGAPGRWLFDQYQVLAPRQAKASHVALILVDPESIRAHGPWPWPRGTLAELVTRIGESGARAIGIDAQFPEADRYNPEGIAKLYPRLPETAKAALRAQPTMDQLFAQEIGHFPVVLARSGIQPGSTDYDQAKVPGADAAPLDNVFSKPLPKEVLSFPRLTANIADLDDVAQGIGVINGPPESDGVVRRVPLAARVAGADMPGLAMELARVGSGQKTITPVLRNGKLTGFALGGTVVPADVDGRLRLHYSTHEQKAFAAGDILDAPPDPKRFAGKIVLIGLAAAGTADIVTTPVANRTYGVLVQAQAVDSILDGEGLVRPGWAHNAEWTGGIILALVILLAAPMLRGWLAFLAPAVIAATLALGSWFAYRYAGLLVDPVRPIVLGLATGGAVLVMLFVEAGRAQRRLSAALEEERIGVARSTGELNAARDIQLGMLPPRDQLRGLHPQVDLDALIEPARTVGGDLYHAMLLDDGRVCFVVGDVTGKGMPAALFMAVSKSQAQSMFSRHAKDLSRAMGELNAALSRDNSQEMFVTMLVGILDPATGRLDLCNAGHENPFRVSADGRVDELVLEGGPPLCVVDDFPYPAESVMLAPGDGIAIVTDGITEAQDPSGDFFGHQRMTRVLAGWTAGRPAATASEGLMAAVRGFEAGGEPSDDVTVLMLRWTGAAA
jgi:adenylate cyclase